MKRRAVGFELKTSYFEQAIKNANGAVMKNAQFAFEWIEEFEALIK